MAEMVGWLHKGVGVLICQAGLQLMQLLREEEVKLLVGVRSQPSADRTANRWGASADTAWCPSTPSFFVPTRKARFRLSTEPNPDCPQKRPMRDDDSRLQAQRYGNPVCGVKYFGRHRDQHVRRQAPPSGMVKVPSRDRLRCPSEENDLSHC